ncbi:MAG: hypothetical protein E7560_06455 [Ruminococcaceae bacterium]|nr:hypothetical protein [Oscillospiraceae bacterium]
MKKILALLIAVILVFSASVTAFADPGAFYDSPSKRNPSLVDSENNDNCTATVVVVPYGERDKLEDDKKEDIEDAYDQIAKTDDITSLTDDLKELGTDPSLLEVSDLFYIDFVGCTEHENHNNYKLTVGTELLENFATLIYYKDGKWYVVNDAKVVNNGKHLTFAAKYSATYAVVIKNEIPKTGDAGVNPVWIVLMVVSAVGLISLSIILKKGHRNEKN